MIFDSLVADFDGEISDEQSQQTLNCALFRSPRVVDSWTTPNSFGVSHWLIV
jgi:hypothetical protein